MRGMGFRFGVTTRVVDVSDIDGFIFEFNGMKKMMMKNLKGVGIDAIGGDGDELMETMVSKKALGKQAVVEGVSHSKTRNECIMLYKYLVYTRSVPTSESGKFHSWILRLNPACPCC